MADEPVLHPNLAPVAFLLGTWEGSSEGRWLADGGITFRERTEFGHVGKPFLTYRQQTWLADGVASHAESGYLGVADDGVLTWTIAEPSGVTEVHAGSVDGTRLELSCVSIGRGPDASNVTTVERQLSVDGDELRYRIRIAMNDEAPADHIEGLLHRAAPAAE